MIGYYNKQITNCKLYCNDYFNFKNEFESAIYYLF